MNKFVQRLGTLVKSLSISIIAWMIGGGLYLLTRFYGTNDRTDWSTTPGILYCAWIIGSILLGLIFWISNRFGDRPSLRKRSYLFLLVFKVFCILFGSLVLLMMSRFLAFFSGEITQQEIIPTFIEKLMGGQMQVLFLFIAAVGIVLSFIRQMAKMMGPNILINLLLGKYHIPRSEERIFMFLDMQSSTRYAEKLGHKKFCRLIQDCFNDLTDSAIKHEVEIYQYVGDEAILTWKIKNGLDNFNCITVYYDFIRELSQKDPYYELHYGLTPKFKAGVNIGKVMVAEIGVIKRDITYLSDVLNTASRIQQQCRIYQKNILISGALKKRLPKISPYVYDHIGNIPLKGKMINVDLYSIENKEESGPKK